MTETRINKDYQITIPKKIRNILDITSDDTLIWNIQEDKIIIQVKKNNKLKNKTLSFINDEEIESIKIEKEN